LNIVNNTFFAFFIDKKANKKSSQIKCMALCRSHHPLWFDSCSALVYHMVNCTAFL